jgi:hypothetical protein
MPYLKIVNGRIVEADPHSSEGHGVKLPTMGEAWGGSSYSGEHQRTSDALEYYGNLEKQTRLVEDAAKTRAAAKARRDFLARKAQDARADEIKRTKQYQEALHRKAMAQGINLPADFATPLSGHALAGNGCPCNCSTRDEHSLKAYMSGNLKDIPQAMGATEYRQRNLQNKIIQAKAAEAKRQALARRRR